MPGAGDSPWVTEWLVASDGSRFVGGSIAAKAWNRSVETVKKWEYRGVIPRTPFDWRGRRAYTVEQVERIAEILDSHGALTWPITRAVRVDEIHRQASELHQELVGKHHQVRT